MKQELTQEYLKEILHYDPDNGLFIRNITICNRYKSGTYAGSIDSHGYIKIVINYKQYSAHRLAFLYMTGELPENQVDHIDGIRTNNKWINLRNATNSDNQQNQRKASKSNKSTGVLGVYFCNKRNRFRAHIGINKKDITLGWFKTINEAMEAYITAKRRFHEFNTL